MLVSIPWQPELKLHPDTLALLEAASKKVGRNLYLYNSDSAWRSYARQKTLWNAYQAGGNPASNPDSGQRSHMRGAAFDLRDTTAAVQAACVAVGLKRDPAEAWHWNHPNWANMPIITADIPAPTAKETIMGAFYRNKTSGGIFWQEKPNTALIPINLATWTAYSANGNKYADLAPADVDALIAKWGQASAPTVGGGGAVVADLTPVLKAIADVPTAEENGSAARTAIVK